MAPKAQQVEFLLFPILPVWSKRLSKARAVGIAANVQLTPAVRLS